MYRVLVAALCASFSFAQNASSPQELLRQAIDAQQAGKLDQAIDDYHTLLAKYPNIPAIRSNLGAALAAEGRYTEAIEEYTRSLKLQANSQVRLNLALAYYKRADLDNAIRTLQQVRAEQPSNLQAATLLADSYLQLAQNKNVIKLLTPLQQAHPDDKSFAYLLGTALVRDGQTDKGQLIIDRILRDGDSAEARLLMGTTKYMVTDFSGARDDFQKAIQLNDKLPDAFAYYGLALLATGDQAGAKDAFARELQTNPNNFESNLHLGVLYRHDEDSDHALQYLKHALVVRPGDPGVRYQIAAIELSQGQLAASQRDLESLLKDSPNFIEAHVTLATVYFREKRKEDGNRERAIFAKLNAVRQAKAEIAVAPAPNDAKNEDTAEAHFLLGTHTFESGDYPAAVKQFASAIALNAKLPQLQSFYGQALLRTGDPDRAIEAFQSAIAADANDFQANLGLAQIAVARGQFQVALAPAKRAASLRPQDGEADLVLAECLVSQRQYDSARPYAEIAGKALTRSIDAHRTLASIYSGLHQSSAAAIEAATVKRLETERAASDPGPQVRETAPDFTLPRVGSTGTLSLRDFHGKSPVVLVFGSYSCPNFRDSAESLKALQHRYGAAIPFLLVYIREAHAGAEWQSTRNTGMEITAAADMNEKTENAAACNRKLHLPFAAVVDRMDNAVETAYNAWPSRAFVIDSDGRVAYSTRLMELDFHPDEMDRVLRGLTQSK